MASQLVPARGGREPPRQQDLPPAARGTALEREALQMLQEVESGTDAGGYGNGAVINVDDLVTDDEAEGVRVRVGGVGPRGMQRCRSSTNLVRSSSPADSSCSGDECTISAVSLVPEGGPEPEPHTRKFADLSHFRDTSDVQQLDEDLLEEEDDAAEEGEDEIGISMVVRDVPHPRRPPLGEITNTVGNSAMIIECGTSCKPASEDTIMVWDGGAGGGFGAGAGLAGGVGAGVAGVAVPAKRAKKNPSSKSLVAPRSAQQPAMAYSADVLRSMLAQEQRMAAPADCMARQSDINARSRSILNNWLIDVHSGYRHRQETLFLSVNVIDRYLALQQVSREKLQLVGITSTLIAAKFEEVKPPDVNDLVFITENSYTRQEVLAMECQILSALHFEIAAPTAAHFLQHFVAERQCCAAPGRSLEGQESLAWHLLELALLDVRMLQFVPSLVAAAALMLSNELHSYRPSWPLVLAHLSGYRLEDLEECADELWRLLELTPMPPNSYQASDVEQHQAAMTQTQNQSYGDWSNLDTTIRADGQSPRRVFGVPASWR